MARAKGSTAQLLGEFESTYGTAPSGNYIKLPFISYGLGSEQGLVESPVIGDGRDPSAPFRDVITVQGSVNVPVDARNFGHWLRALLGAPTTSGAGPYDHTFKTGASTLPSLALELGMPEVPAYLMHTGVVADTLELSFDPSGPAQAAIGLLGQAETKAASSGGGTPTTATYTPFSKFQGSIKREGNSLAGVTAATVNYANGAEAVRTIRNDGLIDGIDPGMASLTGSLTARFADTILYDDAVNGTAVELEFAYTLSASLSLVITVHEVYLPKPIHSVEGPGGISAAYNWQAAANAAAGCMATLVLTNDVASYA